MTILALPVWADVTSKADLLPKCIANLSRIVNLSGLSVTDMRLLLGPYRSSEVRLEDGKHYSVAIDTQSKLRILVRNEDQISASNPIELDAATAKELSSRKITPIAAGEGRFMLLAQGANGHVSIIEILPTPKGLRRSQIQRVSIFQNRADAQGITRGIWLRDGITEAGNSTLNYFYEVTEKVTAVKTESKLIGKVLHLSNHKGTNVSASTEKILFSTDQNASSLHLVTPIDGKFHVAFAKPIQEVLSNNELVRLGSISVYEVDIKTETGNRTGISKLENEIKFKPKASDGAIKSIYFLKAKGSHEQTYVVVELENAAYAGRLFSDLVMSKVDVDLARYISTFEILSQENFTAQEKTSAFKPETVGLSGSLRTNQIILGEGVNARPTTLHMSFENPDLSTVLGN
ncbi:MAG: hypothetical protein IPM57_07990 [Oligoflexia bacterium]|nr:hypothetical protein [Oligoflexia bacterium]